MGRHPETLPDRCGQKIHKSKGDRQCRIGQKENVCLFCSYVFSVRNSQADKGKNAPLIDRIRLPFYVGAKFKVENEQPITEHFKKKEI